MNEHRHQILEMLSVGKVTTDEAERLIAALEKEPSSGATADGFEPGPKAKPKYLRVVVDDAQSDGPVHVNVRVPMQLLRAGVKLASLIPPQARDRLNVAMGEHGMMFDLSQVKPENLEELVDQLQDLTVDVDVDENGTNGKQKTKVRVFCE
jgi:hypothetical protein